MAVYFTTIVATMAGVNYTIQAGFEVNGDAITGAPRPGVTYLRELTEGTDDGFCFCSPPNWIGFVDELPSDPSSPALPMPSPTLGLILVVPDARDFGARVSVGGHLVPEPVSGALLSVGLVVAGLRKGSGRPHRSILLQSLAQWRVGGPIGISLSLSGGETNCADEESSLTSSWEHSAASTRKGESSHRSDGTVI